MKKHLRSMMNATALLLLCLSGFTSVSFAQELPSSTTELPAGSEWGEWNRMTPGAFETRIPEAIHQCRRSSVIDIADPLTNEKCDLLASRLANDECLAVFVPDVSPSGVRMRHDIMNASEGGNSTLKFNVEKHLGRSGLRLLYSIRSGDGELWL